MGRTSMVAVAAALVLGILSQHHGVALPALTCGALLASSIRAATAGVRACLLAALAAGVLLASLHEEPPAVARAGRTAVLEGTVVSEARSEDFGSSFVLRTTAGDVLEVFASGNPPGAGDRLRVRGRVEPFDGPRNPGEPSEAALAAERGLRGRLAHGRILSRAPPDPHDRSAWLPRARAWAAARLRERLEEPGASILAGALWGERGDLPPDLRAEFQDTGTTHVLVTAGLHLGVVAALAAFLLGAAGVARVPAASAGVAVVWAYAWFSGGHLPSLRAATMISFALVAFACGRAAISWNALAAAAIAIGVIWTQSVETLSFALSFSCVGAIALFAKTIASALARAGLKGFAGEAIALALATQVGTWPLTAYAFLVFAPYAALANLLVVPVVGLAMLVGVALLATTPLPPITPALANIEGSLLLWICSVVRMASHLPYAYIVATPPPSWTIVAYDVACVVAAVLLRRRRTVAATAVFCAAVALALWPPRVPRHELTVTVIDVGQADGILIQTPRGHAILVDAGGRLERGPEGSGSPAEAVGERTVVPLLVRDGVHRVDALVLSHPHGDHAGGVAPVLRTLGATTFADSGQTYPGHAYRDALGVATQQNVPIVYPRGGTVTQTDDGVTLRFYGPTLPPLSGTRNDINNNSLVFRLEYGNFRMLFMGDAGAEAEARILASGDDVHADILKVGHHGSAYSSTPDFIRAVSPRYAVISVGRDNLFGHPAASTIETLRAAGAHVYRTDENGAVTIGTDGDLTTVQPFLTP